MRTNEQRLDYKTVLPEAFEAMLAFSKSVHTTGLEKNLINLVLMRASQINGCAWCLNMHTKDAKSAGESDQRLYLLPVWRDAPLYTEREVAALEWTEAVTQVSKSDYAYEIVKKQFSEKEMVDLTMIIIEINGWNRLNAAFKTNVACDI